MLKRALIGTKVGLKAQKLAAFLGRGAVQGAVADTFDETATQDNFTGAIVKQYPQFDNFLATKDADHPSLKLFKNVVENMGIGIVFDTTLMALSKGLKGGADAAMEQVARRTESVEKQVKEMGGKQAESPEFGGYKNKPIADPQQGNPTSGLWISMMLSISAVVLQKLEKITALPLWMS